MTMRSKLLPMRSPLQVTKLRTAGLASVESAKFGMVRKNKDGTLRAHQGIDLQAEINTPCYAVANGRVISIERELKGYGLMLTLEVGTQSKGYLYCVYCHLKDVREYLIGRNIPEGELLCWTGDSGNAEGMNTIARGGHLHFEIRTSRQVGRGLEGRLNPLNFIKINNVT